MRRHVGILLLYCVLLLPPARSIAQRPIDEEQRVRLGISIDQQKQMETLFTGAAAKRKATQARMHALYHDLHDLYEVYTIDQTQATALQNQLLAEHRKLIVLFAENETKLRLILTANQFQKLHQEMKADRERRRREHPHPGENGWKGEHGPGRPEGSETPLAPGPGQRKG